MANRITGRCFCGAVQFHFDDMPIARRACWCRDCQYLSSGNASINAIFKTATFAVTGKVSDYISTADSGNIMRRSFCPNCGTPLFSRAMNRPDLMVVRGGALDDPALSRPESYIWTASVPDWGLYDEALPNCEAQPAAIPNP
jgi:hypothetical protein